MRLENKSVVRIGIVGTGFISKGFVRQLMRQHRVKVTGVLTRTDPAYRTDYPLQHLLVQDADAFLEHVDLVVECSGDVIHGTQVILKAMNQQLPVITLNAELQVTTGSYLASKGFLTEAEGDQPGCLAALRENAVMMGFEPLVYGNIKGFLNHHPTYEDMLYWSKKQGISLPKQISFTDGTKVQIEQTLVANGLGATIAKKGLIGPRALTSQIGGPSLAELAEKLKSPISDYILSPESPAGVFITGTHQSSEQDCLRYYKMGEGPYYTLQSNYHLCHLEMMKTVDRVMRGDGILLNNGVLPKVSTAAIAKTALKKGSRIMQGIGGFELRGEAVLIEEAPDYIPIGLIQHGVMMRHVDPGQIITWEDIELPHSLAMEAWNHTLQHVRCAASA
ncbi:NAD(P)-dependent oxidoreductase [Marinicrinis sediminis]|uniref:NAD(P)-dependent oxidoreductase n=1 Tax=Marinicrinis sediminis TaxID=1652465 RepID=A0ABW5RDF8_9BACL